MNKCKTKKERQTTKQTNQEHRNIATLSLQLRSYNKKKNPFEYIDPPPSRGVGTKNQTVSQKIEPQNRIYFFKNEKPLKTVDTETQQSDKKGTRASRNEEITDII